MKISTSKKILFIATTVISFTAFAGNLFAQNYVPLTPLPNQTSGTAVDINNYIPTVFSLTIGIAGALAVVMIVIGGIQYLSTDAISGKEEGKERIRNAILGLLLAIGSYAILYTINPEVLKFNLDNITAQKPPGDADGDGVPDSSDTCANTPQGSAVDSSGCPTTGQAGGSGTALFCTRRSNPTCWSFYKNGDPWPDDSGIRSQLHSDITVTGTSVSTPCKKVDDQGCTSLFGLPTSAISGLNYLASACPSCIITVTGGTEFWKHWTHGPGYAQVDLHYGNTSDTIYKFLQNSSQSGASSVSPSSCIPGSNYKAWSLNGAIYVLEGGHWHVCF